MTGQTVTSVEGASIGCRLLRGTAGTSRFDGEGEAQAAKTARREYRSRTGADRSAIAMKARNGAGVKGLGQAVVRSKQLETGRC
jgi:hypothetical protein